MGRKRTVEATAQRFEEAGSLLKENDVIGIFYAMFINKNGTTRSWEVEAYSLEEAQNKIANDKFRGIIPGVFRDRKYDERVYLSHTVKTVVRFPED